MSSLPTIGTIVRSFKLTSFQEPEKVLTLLNQINSQLQEDGESLKEQEKQLLAEQLEKYLIINETALKATQIYNTLIATLQRQLKEPVLQNVISNLGNSDPQLRKASHLLLISCIKKSNENEVVLSSFVSSGFMSYNSQVRQKSINSFQGLVLTESSAVDWSTNEAIYLVETLLNTWQNDVYANVQKAAENSLASLLKIEQVKKMRDQLSEKHQQAIKLIAEKYQIFLPGDREAILKMTAISFSKSLKLRNSNQFCVSNQKGYSSQRGDVSPVKQMNLFNFDQQLLKFGLISQQQCQDLKNHYDLRAKTQAVEELEQAILQAQSLKELEDEIFEFLDIILNLIEDPNFKVQLTSLNIIHAICSLRKCADQTIFILIGTSILNKLGDNKIAVRQIARKIILQHAKSYERNGWLTLLLNSLKFQSNQQLEDESLSVLEQLISESNTKQYDWKYVIKELYPLLNDPRERIRIKCISCLTKIFYTMQDSELFLQYIQLTFSKDHEFQILKAIGAPKDYVSQLGYKQSQSSQQQNQQQMDGHSKQNLNLTGLNGRALRNPNLNGQNSLARYQAGIQQQQFDEGMNINNKNMLRNIVPERGRYDSPFFIQQSTQFSDSKSRVSQISQNRQLLINNFKTRFDQSSENQDSPGLINESRRVSSAIDSERYTDPRLLGEIPTLTKSISSSNKQSTLNTTPFGSVQTGYGGIQQGFASYSSDFSSNPSEKRLPFQRQSSQQALALGSPLNFEKSPLIGANRKGEDNQAAINEIKKGDKDPTQAVALTSSYIVKTSSEPFAPVRGKQPNLQNQNNSIDVLPSVGEQAKVNNIKIKGEQPQEEKETPIKKSMSKEFDEEAQKSLRILKQKKRKNLNPPMTNCSLTSFDQEENQKDPLKLTAQQPITLFQTPAKSNIHSKNASKVKQNGEDAFILNEPKKAENNQETSQNGLKKLGLKQVLNADSNYLTEQELEPVLNPEKTVSQLLGDLKSSDWEKQFQTLDSIRRISKFNSDLLAKSPSFVLILKEVNCLIENLRSSLAKNAMTAIKEMATSLKKQIESQLEDSMSRLFKKGQDTNAFISESVSQALQSLCQNCSASRVLNCCFAQNGIKSSLSKLCLIECYQSVVKFNKNKLFGLKEFDKMIESLCSFAFDGSQDVRSSSRLVIQLLVEIDSLKVKDTLLNYKDEQSITKLLNSFDPSGTSSALKASNSILSKTARSSKSMLNSSSSSTVLKSQSYHNIPTPTQSQQQEKSPKLPNISRLSKPNSLPRLSRLPDQLEEITLFFAASESENWTIRLSSIGELEKIVTNFPAQVQRSKHLTHLLDTFSKLNTDSNMKVQIKSLEAFHQLVPLLEDSFGNNLQSVMNSIFSSCSSQNAQIKRKAEEIFETMIKQVDSQLMFEPLNNGALFANLRSKPLIIQHLTKISRDVSNKKQTAFQKTIIKTITKLVQENKVELKQSLKLLLQEVYAIMSEDMFVGSLSTLRSQIMELLK